MKFSKRSGCLSFVFIFIVIMYLTMHVMFKCPSLSDMQEYFTNHQEFFETTNNQIMSTMLSGKTFVPKESGSYKNILWLKVIGDKVDQDFQVRYFTHIKGIGVGSYGTGIAYLNSPPKMIYGDFESMNKDASEEEGFVGYCSIKGPWYIFFWEAD
ncbi:MAG: hypothetical protein KJ630_05060 [Proteobacteria bacterium]|nr:hypothetical protein [Pseudomonadota bacterium]